MSDSTSTARVRQRLQEHFEEYGWPDGWPVSEPRYRYYQTGNGAMFCWTTERFEGKFVSMVYKPVGKGARAGTATEWQLVKSGRWRSVKHAKRKDAKARALRLFNADQS